MKHSPRWSKCGSGFTLLEVLVALALLAITLASALRLAAQGAATTTFLRDRTFAEWVALNELARQQLATEWPPTGVTRGSAPMGGREWAWELRVSKTGDQNLRQLDITVGERESPLAHRTGYVLGPLRPRGESGMEATGGTEGGAP